MTSKEWEKHTLNKDKKITKKIRKYRNRSSGRVILLLIALLIFIWAISVKSKADELDTEMLRWMPGKAEIEDLRSSL